MRPSSVAGERRVIIGSTPLSAVIRYKNPRTDTSLLTPAESTRFRAALFRLWLFLVFPEKHEESDDGDQSEGFLTDGEGNDDDDGDEDDVQEQQASQQPQPAETYPLLDCDDALEHLDCDDLQDAFLIQTFLDGFVFDVNKRNEWKGAAGKTFLRTQLALHVI
jgi:hypothetical protein